MPAGFAHADCRPDACIGLCHTGHSDELKQRNLTVGGFRRTSSVRNLPTDQSEHVDLLCMDGLYGSEVFTSALGRPRSQDSRLPGVATFTHHGETARAFTRSHPRAFAPFADITQ